MSNSDELLLAQQWMEPYIKEIATNYNIRINNNVTSLLCRCDYQSPPEQQQCGKFPSWCLGLRCRGEKCRHKKKWYVCILCINITSKNKKMYRPQQLILHNQLHETVLMASAKKLSKASHENYNVDGIALQENARNRSSDLDVLITWPADVIRPSPDLFNNHAIVNPSLEKHIDYYRALEKGEAMTYVVNKQFALDNNISSSISKLSATLHTLIASVSFSQSKSESSVFAQLLFLINENNNIMMQELISERNYYR